MATKRQIEANRLNAQRSTGPRTPEGKARSAKNALRSGLDAESQFVLFESPEEFAALQNEYFRRFLPRTPEERYQVDRLIRNEWLLRRMFVVEGQLWNYHIKLGSPLGGTGMGEAFDRANPVFMRLQRRIAALETSYRQASDELRLLQAARAEVEAAGAGAPEPVEPLPAPVPDASQTEETEAQTGKSASFRNPADLAAPEPAQPAPLHLPESAVAVVLNRLRGADMGICASETSAGAPLGQPGC